MRAWAPLAALALVLVTKAACEGSLPSDPPPGTCTAGELYCYAEPVSGRELLLRCNDGEVEGAIWLVAEVCVDGALCDVDHCTDGGGGP